ncbi:hypothetical protein AAG906_012499 [Vitis piasezkii]
MADVNLYIWQDQCPGTKVRRSFYTPLHLLASYQVCDPSLSEDNRVDKMALNKDKLTALDIFSRANVKYGLLLTVFSMGAMVVAFVTGLYAVLPLSSGLPIVTCIICCCIFLLAFYFVFRQLLKYVNE